MLAWTNSHVADAVTLARLRGPRDLGVGEVDAYDTARVADLAAAQNASVPEPEPRSSTPSPGPSPARSRW